MGKGICDMISIDHDESVSYYDLLCIHHQLDVARQLHQEMAISDQYLVSSKVRMSNTPKFPSLSSPSLILKGFWFWDQDARILPCTMFRVPSAVPGRSVVSANNLDREVKGHRKFEHRAAFFRRVFKSWQRVFVRYNIDDLLCIHHHLDVARQLHQEMAILDEYLVSAKAQMGNTPKFPSLLLPSLILKGFWFWDQDARILPSTMFRGPSAVPGRSVVSASNLDREVKRHENFEKRRAFFTRVFKSWQRVFVRYDIDDLLCIHHHLDVARQLHQEMAILDEYLVSSKAQMGNTAKFPSRLSPSLILKGFWFWDQDARILPCTMFRGPSAGPGRSVVNANNLDREVKGHRKFEHRPGSCGRVFNTWERACEIWYRLIMMNLWAIMISYVSIISLTWRDSCIKRWQFPTSTSYHPKFEWATLPNFRHFRHLHSSWKGFDSGIRMQGYCLVQCSGVHQQFLADQWSVQTIWIARWKGMEILKRGRHFLEESSKAGKGYLWDIISTIYYVSIITLTWLDSCIKRWQFWTSTSYHPKLNGQHSQISVTFVTFTHPERVLILGSGCKDIAFYNVQGSISSSWQISGQCKQSGSRGEKASKFWKEAGIFYKSLQKLANGICEIWYRRSIMYPSSPWRG